jgi:hydroxymethylbilane synthase
MSRALAGSCTVPLGAYAQVKNNIITITGFVASVDGKEMVKEKVTGGIDHPEKLGSSLLKNWSPWGKPHTCCIGYALALR